MTQETNPNETQLLAAMSIDEPLTEYKAKAGQKLLKGTPKSSKEEIIEAIRQVYDPEIPINVYDMGLIYDINLKDNGDVFIDMTLTAPGCPVAGVLPQHVADAVACLENVGEVEVKIVWEPQWTIECMTDEGKALMDLF